MIFCYNSPNGLRLPRTEGRMSYLRTEIVFSDHLQNEYGSPLTRALEENKGGTRPFLLETDPRAATPPFVLG